MQATHTPTPLPSLTLGGLLAAIAAKTPAPGGGAVASITGALAQMVLSYSLGKKSLAPHEAELAQAMHVLGNARGLLLGLADEDAAAYGAVNELGRLPETDPRRIAEYPLAVEASVQVPLATAAACVDLLRLFARLAGITNRQLRSDLAIAAILCDAAVRASRWNVLVNAGSLPPAGQGRVMETIATLTAESGRLCVVVEGACSA